MSRSEAVAPAVRSDRQRSERQAIRAGAVARFLMVWVAAWWIPLFLLLPRFPGRAFVLAGVALWALGPIPLLLRAFIGRRYPSARLRLLVFRPFWYLQLFMPLAALAGVIGALLGLPFGAPGTAGTFALSAALAVLALLAAAGYAGTRQLTVRPLELAFTDLPEAFDGLRIVQISDLHVGPHTRTSFLSRVAAAVDGARPDLVVITGDQVDDFAEDTSRFVAAFGRLRAPFGVYAVAGNHDIYAGWQGVRDRLAAAGVVVLENAAVAVHRGWDRLWIAGTGDPAAGPGGLPIGGGPAPNIARTLAAVPPGAFVVALAHNPVLWPALSARGAQLTLSGHTHYGQFAIPRLGWSVASVFLRHAHGIHRDGGQTLYINPGTNYWGIPFRLGTPPEVTVVTLRRAAAAAA